jgi:hypothetical protein
LHFIRLSGILFEMHAKIGDKVRLKGDGHTGARGVVVAVRDGALVVEVVGIHRPVRVPEQAVTNFSLAARKAWKSMPTRQVGRPKGARHCDRMSVTLRIDRETWERFRGLEENGLIENRTATINAALRELVRRTDERKGAGHAAADH